MFPGLGCDIFQTFIRGENFTHPFDTDGNQEKLDWYKKVGITQAVTTRRQYWCPPPP